MLDITKNRSSYQRLPILKQQQQQKCKQSNVQLVPNVTKLNSYVTKAAAANNYSNVPVAVAATATATATKTTIQHKKFTTTTTTNKVRAANELYFLTQEYKDPNFLKKECESAQAQLGINGTPKKTQRSTTLDDKRNNNNNNSNQQFQ